MVWPQSRKPSSVSGQRSVEEMPVRPIRGREMIDGVDLDTYTGPKFRIASCYTPLPAASGHGLIEMAGEFKQVCARSEHDCGTKDR